MPRCRNRLSALAATALCVSGLAFAAAPLDTAIETHVEVQEHGPRSQDQVEKLDDGTQASVIEYRGTQAEVGGWSRPIATISQ